MKPLLVALLLALAAPAQAGPDAYAYTRVIVGAPVSCVSPCSVTLTFTLPVPALMQPPYLKDCRYWASHGAPEWWDGVPVVLDHHVGLVQGSSVLARGVYTWVLSDTDPGGREQRICPRFVMVPLHKLYDAMEGEEE